MKATITKTIAATGAGVVSSALSVPAIVNVQDVSWILFWLFLADFVTGVAASYFEWKKTDRKDRWFFGKGEGFSSDKAKKCGIKACLYIGLPRLSVEFQETFMIKNVTIKSFTTAELDMPTCILLFFCVVELFSIFNENLPKCGINVWRIIKKILGFYKEVKDAI